MWDMVPLTGTDFCWFRKYHYPLMVSSSFHQLQTLGRAYKGRKIQPLSRQAGYNIAQWLTILIVINWTTSKRQWEKQNLSFTYLRTCTISSMTGILSITCWSSTHGAHMFTYIFLRRAHSLFDCLFFNSVLNKRPLNKGPSQATITI